MKPVSILLALLSLAPLHAELPSVIASMLKQQADQFAAAMKAYDTNVEAMVKRDRGNDVRLQLADRFQPWLKPTHGSRHPTSIPFAEVARFALGFWWRA